METHPDAEEMPPAVVIDAPAELPLESSESAAPEPPAVAESEPEPTAPTDSPDNAAPERDAAGAEDPLTDLTNRAQVGRLAAVDEERLTALLKEALLAGKAGVVQAAENLPKLPWIVGVRAVESAWAEMKVTARTQLLKGLADQDSDAARRVRLSLARALFKLDPAAALKLAIAVCKDLREGDTGDLPQRHAHIFANVFIGKAKPWIAQLPLADLKPNDADLLVHCAVSTVFNLPHPPVTQLGVIKWAAGAGRLEKLQEDALALIVKGLSRWSGKWQAALQKEVPALPEAILSALPPPPAPREPNETPPAPAAGEEPREEGSPAPEADGDGAETAVEPVRKERPVYEPRPQRPQPPTEAPAEGDREPRRDRERPVYQPRGGGGGTQSFNLADALRQIDAHVQSLRSELSAAQTRLRQRDDERGKSRRAPERPANVVIAGEPTPDELARLNQQLEARITELQARIDELLADSEDRAASIGAHADQPVNDADAQLRTLLALKLQDDFSDFVALDKESPSVVVQQHYRELLRHTFDVLRQQGVPLNG